MHRMLLCPPDFYSIRYEINPWMSQSRAVDPAAALAQWRQLHETLLALGCEVVLLTPEPDWPDMVFTANAGLVHGRRFLSAKFRHLERQGETPAYERWFAQHDYELLRMAGSHAFEGEGDALWLGSTLVCGHGFRTDRAAHDWLAATLGCKVLGLELADPHFYHLDACFCPLGDGVALWHPPAFVEESRRLLLRQKAQLIAVPEAEARRFACNAVVLGRQVLIPAECPQTCALLTARGFDCHPLPMGEFIKAGGACKCLVLHLER